MKKILFVDDEVTLQKAVQASFRSDFEVTHADSMKGAIECLNMNSDFALAIIDRRLPDGDGLSLANFIRQSSGYSNLPIIFLSGMTSESDRISGFFAGADDYVTKPFSLLELKARVFARLRTPVETPAKQTFGHLEIDADGHRVYNIGVAPKVEIILTRIEFKILMTLLQAKGAVVDRETLLMRIWGQETNVSDRVIDSHISHLRHKITDAGVQLLALRGEGYRLEVDSRLKTGRVG